MQPYNATLESDGLNCNANLCQVWVRGRLEILILLHFLSFFFTLYFTFYYTATQVEIVTDNAEVQCEILNLPTCSTPLCSPAKSVECPSDDDHKDVDYIPPINLFPADDIEEHTDGIGDNQSKYQIYTYIHIYISLCILCIEHS